MLPACFGEHFAASDGPDGYAAPYVEPRLIDGICERDRHRPVDRRTESKRRDIGAGRPGLGRTELPAHPKKAASGPQVEVEPAPRQQMVHGIERGVHDIDVPAGYARRERRRTADRQ